MLDPNIQKRSFHLISKFNIVLICFAAWILAQLLIPIKFLPNSLISQLEIYKSLIPAIGITLCLALYLDKLKFNAAFLPFILFSIFCVFKAFILLIIISTLPFDILYQTIMYTLWILLMFVAGPSFLNSLSKLKLFLRFVIIIFCTVIIISFLFIYYFGLETSTLYRDGRFTFIYGNPLYLGAIVYSLLCCSLLLKEFNISRIERIALSTLSMLCLLALIASFSRTFLLATLFLLATNFYFQKPKLGWITIIFILISLVTGLLFFIIQITSGTIIDRESINSLSSGRLLNWVGSFQDLDGWNLLWGNDGSSSYLNVLNSADGEEVNASFQRYAVDNSYIEIFINTGIIGFSLFCWGLINIFLMIKFINLNLDKNNIELGRILSTSYAVLSSLLVAAIFYGFYPSLGNTINAAIFPPIFSIIFLAYNLSIKDKSKDTS